MKEFFISMRLPYSIRGPFYLDFVCATSFASLKLWPEVQTESEINLFHHHVREAYCQHTEE